NDFSTPLVYGNLERAKIVLVGWGSIKGILLETQKQIPDCAVIHFNHVYPLDKEKVIKLFNQDKRYVLVENNSTGQFGKLLQMEIGIEIKEKVLRYDGRPITVKEVMVKVK
ncbi:2-oxoacid:acceptor oxidoreductase subunit alpha, partial [Candidatus Roizmanbacteria bacterium CG_4_10_14_3_um_filter_33_21]